MVNIVVEFWASIDHKAEGLLIVCYEKMLERSGRGEDEV